MRNITRNKESDKVAYEKLLSTIGQLIADGRQIEGFNSTLWYKV